MKRPPLHELAPAPWFRAAVALALVIAHLVAFDIAGHRRLGVPFNSAPGEAPYYSDPDSRELMAPPRQPHHWSRLIVSRWDAQHYIGFAIRGMYACKEGTHGYALVHCGVAWMPTLGLLARPVADTTGAPADYVVLLFALIAALVLNFLWTSKTIVKRLGLLEAYGALLAFNMFASAFYIVTPYNEPIVVACTLGAYICLANRWWFRSSALIGAATAFRPTALGFVLGFGCAALVAAWEARKAGEKRWWWPLASCVIAGWGQLVMMVLFWVDIGDAKAYVHAQLEFGGRDPGFHLHRFIEPTFWFNSISTQHMDGITFIGAVTLVALGARSLAKKLPRAELVFLAAASLLMAFLPMSTVDGYWGWNRYFMLCPIIFFAAGEVLRSNRGMYILWAVISLFMYWHVEMCSYIAHGNKQICPCLGKNEWTMPYQS